MYDDVRVTVIQFQYLPLPPQTYTPYVKMVTGN
jgi:hypothetical protein